MLPTRGIIAPHFPNSYDLCASYCVTWITDSDHKQIYGHDKILPESYTSLLNSPGPSWARLFFWNNDLRYAQVITGLHRYAHGINDA